MKFGSFGVRNPIANGVRYGLMFVPLAFLLLFFFYPLMSILGIGLWPDGKLDLSSFFEIIGQPYYLEILWFTFWQASLSTLLTLVFALPAAYVFTRYRFPGKSLLLSLSTLPFVLPTVIVAAAFSALLGDNGVINNLLVTLVPDSGIQMDLERTLAIILIVHVFYNFAIALRMITGYWANQSYHIEEAARVLGAHGWSLWWYVRLPVLRPAIVSAAVLVYIFTFTSFGVILILGGPQFATIEVEIYVQAVSLFDLPVASALSVIQLLVMFGMITLYTRLQSNTTVDWQRATQIARYPQRLGERVFLALILIFMSVLLFMPLLALILRSFMSDGGFSFVNYTALLENTRRSALFVAPIEAVSNSLQFALVTMVIAVPLGVLASYLLAVRRARWYSILDPVFMLPLAASAVTLGFGFTIALDEPPVNLVSSWIVIPVAHTLVAMPFVVRSVLPALRNISPSLRQSAAILGATPSRVWRRIDLPLISRGVLVGATFAFTVSLGEFGASLFIFRADLPTMPIAIFQLLGRPGFANYGQAMALSVILVAICSVSFILLERIRIIGMGEF